MNTQLTRGARPTSAVILSGARSAQSKDPCISPGSPPLGVPHSSRQLHHRDGWDRTPLYLALLFVAIFLATTAHAQGCAQCLDSTRATPPAVQAAYRHAIYLMIGVASTIFLVGLYLFRREP